MDEMTLSRLIDDHYDNGRYALFTAIWDALEEEK